MSYVYLYILAVLAFTVASLGILNCAYKILLKNEIYKYSSSYIYVRQSIGWA